MVFCKFLGVYAVFRDDLFGRVLSADMVRDGKESESGLAGAGD